jgi:hypothetical protein
MWLELTCRLCIVTVFRTGTDYWRLGGQTNLLTIKLIVINVNLCHRKPFTSHATKSSKRQASANPLKT